MYLFKRDLLNKNCKQTLSVASQAGSPINNTNLELLLKLGLDVSKESLEALTNNIKELTIKEDRKFIETAIRLYNNVPT